MCTRHPDDSVYCAKCVKSMWTASHREIPACESCGKKMNEDHWREILLARGSRETSVVTVNQFDQHLRFLNGDPEIPMDSWNHRICACHDPPCQGSISKNGNWIIFRATFKVPVSVWNADQSRYIYDKSSLKRHSLVCAHCLRPSLNANQHVDGECIYCLVGCVESKRFAVLRHYINPLAGAHGQWRMPIRVHELSEWALRKHLYFLLEDPHLFLVCPIDGTILEHGTACHEMTCPTCNLVKLCFCCGRAEVVGRSGAMIDHFGDLSFQCRRYPSMYKWMIDDGTTILYPCSDECTNLGQRCDIEDHQEWYSLYHEYRRARWVERYFLELPLSAATRLFVLLGRHPAWGKNRFRSLWHDLIPRFLTVLEHDAEELDLDDSDPDI